MILNKPNELRSGYQDKCEGPSAVNRAMKNFFDGIKTSQMMKNWTESSLAYKIVNEIVTQACKTVDVDLHNSLSWRSDTGIYGSIYLLDLPQEFLITTWKISNLELEFIPHYSLASQIDLTCLNLADPDLNEKIIKYILILKLAAQTSPR